MLNSQDFRLDETLDKCGGGERGVGKRERDKERERERSRERDFYILIFCVLAKIQFLQTTEWKKTLYLGAGERTW